MSTITKREDWPVMLPLAKIRVDAETHGRVLLDTSVVNDYIDELERGVEFPPVVVFHDGRNYYLADGFYRWHAHQRAGRSHIPSDVHPGGVREAKMYAASANTGHGLRRSYADRRRAVVFVLDDDEARKWSPTQIAAHCGVSPGFVRGIQVAWRKLPAAERGVLQSQSALAIAGDDKTPTGGDEDINDDTPERQRYVAQLKRSLNKAGRKCELLGLSLEQAVALWRAKTLTLEAIAALPPPATDRPLASPDAQDLDQPPEESAEATEVLAEPVQERPPPDPEAPALPPGDPAALARLPV